MKTHFLIPSIFWTAIFGLWSLCAQANNTEQVRAVLGQVLNSADQVVEQRRNMSANDQAQIYYEAQVDARPCSHCPEYLKTVHQVNKIVEELARSPRQDTQLQNRALTEVNRLKFQYYEARVYTDQGDVLCDINRHHDPINGRLIERDHTHLVAERVLSLNDVTDFAIYPFGENRETRYFYRGEGSQSHVLVEIIVRSDQTALIRYHHYEDAIYRSLPALGSDRGLPLSGGDQREHRLAQEIAIQQKEQIGFSHQSSQASLNIDQRDWVQVETRHNTAQNIEISSVVPVKIEIAETDFSLQGSYRTGQTFEYASESVDQTRRQTITLGLTDHNHEYLRVTQTQREQVAAITGNTSQSGSTTFSSKYSLGDYGQIGASYTEDHRGQHSQQISHSIGNKETRTTTTFIQNQQGHQVELSRSQRLSETASASLTLRSKDSSLSTLLFQVEMKF